MVKTIEDFFIFYIYKYLQLEAAAIYKLLAILQENFAKY